MSITDKQVFLCSCNGTAEIDPEALRAGLDLPVAPPVRAMLCQRELGAFADGARGDVIVGCTQEARLFGEIAEEAGRTQAIRFVNLRETGGWSAQRGATPKIAALLAAAAMPDPEPVPRIGYASSGQVLVIGPLGAAQFWAESLKDRLAVTVLATGRTVGAELPAVRDYPVYSGRVASVSGWLGAFEVQWAQENPIDLDVCVRCNACIKACPEHAIDWSYQIDLDRCADHRRCVAACGEVAAIDFARRDVARSERFDLVLDLGQTAVLRMPQPPQGYFAPGPDPVAQAKAVTELAAMTGEFEKPKYFAYKASICAHARSRQIGCTACIDVCSTEAIREDGDHVFVEPHLCMGCGTCAVVCPSGAMSYAYPSVPDLGDRIRTMLAAYDKAGGRDAVVLFHTHGSGDAIARHARRGRGLPPRVVPLEVHSVTAIGLDTWLSALSWGASGIAVLPGDQQPQHERAALAFQMHLGDMIAQSLGYQGEHFRLLTADAALALDSLWSWPPALSPRVPATFRATADKRTTISLSLDHLALHAPVPQQRIALPRGSPFGAIAVDRDVCTMCLACVGSCPEGALLDATDAPRLRFVESKCVQCGICASTCPENAISLEPRLDLTPDARSPRVLNEAKVVGCVRCGKPLGTEKMIGAMLARLAGHSMFSEPGALDRLRMCADCRVVDLLQNEKSVDIGDL
jgi:ferredoxin